ncbi:probable E3 ubiquitin-protein ligase XBOS32 [Phragmites australis]|uniref:probable E3 ubiquitin-protein ligase XBOS32 n=1 Tax=Phragmites australis TaxID=29695 RepID=UPI002D76F997|nr:probable E3 ubiquitin-protein ligase XBOS32 [Phragmites australis]
MGFLSLVGNSFGCSASSGQPMLADRDGDLLEACALLEYNLRLARYSTFGGHNSLLHYAATQGHHGIVSLSLESGVKINLRNYWDCFDASMPIWSLGGCSNTDAFQCKCSQDRLSQWWNCSPFCCTAWSCSMPSSCARRLCAKHTELLHLGKL